MAKRGKKPWYEKARDEGRICRICHDPVGRSTWNDKTYNHLCVPCFLREQELADRNGLSSWKVGSKL
jgi:hypothetical protein